MASAPRTAVTPSVASPRRASSPRPPTTPRALSPTAWRPRQELTLVEWAQQGQWLGALGRACKWWIGDWIRYGNARYGEKYDAAVRLTGYDVQSLMNMAYVASRFDLSRRREKLSWSHHAEVAALRPEEQQMWLDRAESQGLSVRRLREERRRARRTGRPSPELEGSRSDKPVPAQQSLVCPECGHRFEPDNGPRAAQVPV